MDRRQFIAAAALLTGGGLTAALFWSKGEGGGDADPLAVLDALACESGGSNTLGDWYLARNPEVSDPDLLMRSIFGNEGLELQSPAKMQARLRDLIRLDYEQGHTLQAEGWTLSVRELQSCALVLLQRRNASGRGGADT